MSIAPASVTGGDIFIEYTKTLTVSGGTGPYINLSISGFDGGNTGLTEASFISLNLLTGTINLSGTATSTGTVTFTVVASDTAGGSLSQLYTIVISPALSITPAVLVGGDVGVPYDRTAVVGSGTTPYTFVSVPAGSFNAGGTGMMYAGIIVNANGSIEVTGTPTAPGTVDVLGTGDRYGGAQR